MLRFKHRAGRENDGTGAHILAGKTAIGTEFQAFWHRHAAAFAVTSSCMKTVSAPSGMAAPVKMRTAVPGLSERRVRAPGHETPGHQSVVSLSGRKSACRTA